MELQHPSLRFPCFRDLALGRRELPPDRLEAEVHHALRVRRLRREQHRLRHVLQELGPVLGRLEGRMDGASYRKGDVELLAGRDQMYTHCGRQNVETHY